MRPGLILCAWLALFPILGAMQAQAHLEQTLLTTITLNSRTQRLEIIHQIYAHDIEHAFGNAVQADGGLDRIPAQAMVGIELSSTFKLWDADGEEIPLTLVGAELEAEFFYIYQEAELTSIPEVMRVDHGMLRNHWPNMQNYLNVDYGNFIKSLIFSNNDGAKTITNEQ
ncbi:MAG: hypothetical protein COA71_07000 [SAR86 cluster bacterium]|uniref:Orphan protein n=1 Tax=SAR86 cluster bacterium TaxID=2030880 RepID=A0A2A5CDD0_9GAMM|nr:hypothetical protein [Gammaproteobacteria bacterium AH-315-E17]PCJ41753.1 MAG: hypothetical protein COA71_07000 [SAR86 cluster bacterium]